MRQTYLALLCVIGIFAACKNDTTTNSGTTTQTNENKIVTEKIDSHYVFPVQNMPDSVERKLDPKGLWPIAVPPILPGSILPKYRIVAYYGNLFSKKMGALGEYPKLEMFAKLKQEVQNYAKADTTHPVMPALHAVVTTAQGKPGADGKYRLRMSEKMVDTLLVWAKEINAIVFLDIQVGQSTLQSEIPAWEKYLKMPNVHLGIDPEFSMKEGDIPGKRIGSFNDADINWALDYLKNLVNAAHIPPKILVVHRFKTYMVENSQNIKPLSEAQVVIDMDGWGSKELKLSTQLHSIYSEPIGFTGFKLFYKNDIRGTGWKMMTPDEVMAMYPAPLYIQFQ
jgi:hypothetical protein